MNNMFLVAKSLENLKIEIPDWSRKDKRVVPGCKRVRSFDVYDLAFLLTIACRQHDADPKKGWDEEKCFCFGSKGQLAKLARFSKSKIEESRKFMQALNFITYKEYDADCVDLDDPNNPKSHYNVYRLNKDALALQKHIRPPMEDESEDDDSEGASRVPDTRSPRAPHAPPACPARSDITDDNTENTIIPKNTTKHDHGDGGKGKDADLKRAEFYKKYIIGYCHLEEEQANQIGIRGIMKGTAKKAPSDIQKVVQECAEKKALIKNKFDTWIALLVKDLKAIPETSEALPSPEELEKQFSAAQPVPATQGVSSRDVAFKAGFDRLKVNQHLVDATVEQVNEIKAAFVNAFQGESDRRLAPAFETLINNLPPPAADVPTRCATILSALKVNR